FKISVSKIDVFEMPAAAVQSEVKIFVAQQPKTMAANLIGLAQNFRRFIGQMFTQQFRALRTFTASELTARKEELPRSRRGIRAQPYRPMAHAHPVHEQVALPVEFLPRAHSHLFPVHPG